VRRRAVVIALGKEPYPCEGEPLAGKPTFIEKANVDFPKMRGIDRHRRAQPGLVLMVDHTFLYSAPVEKSFDSISGLEIRYH